MLKLKIGDYIVNIEALKNDRDFNEKDTEQFLCELGNIAYISATYHSHLNFKGSEACNMEWFRDITDLLESKGFYDDLEV